MIARRRTARPVRASRLAPLLALLLAWSALAGAAPSAAADNAPPVAPSGLTVVASAVRATLTVTWAASADDVATVGYRVHLAPHGTPPVSVPPVGLTPSTTWVTAALAPGRYDVAVVAVDAAGNASAASPVATPVLPAVPPASGNLLTANQSSVEGSTGGFEVSSGGVVFARTTAAASAGVGSLAVIAKVAGPVAVRTARGWTPVAPGAAYSSSIDVRTAASVAAGRRACVKLRWWDALGRQVATTNGPWTPITSARWTRVLAPGQVAPLGAVTVSTSVLVEKADANDTYYADRWGLWRSAAVPAWTVSRLSTGTFAVVLGDSYEQGSGGSGPLSRWTSLVAPQRGWRELNYGRGGSGYLTNGTAPASCGYATCPSILAMTAPAAVALPPVVIVAGGRNDLQSMIDDPASVHAAVDATYARLRSRLPSARIVAVSPMWDSLRPTPELITLSGWVQQAAAANGAEFVGGAEQWLVGRPEWISADGVHPNDAGYRQLAYRVLGAVS